MKFATLTLLTALAVTASLTPMALQAKSVKWSCVEVSPSHFVCTGSSSRP